MLLVLNVVGQLKDVEGPGRQQPCNKGSKVHSWVLGLGL